MTDSGFKICPGCGASLHLSGKPHSRAGHIVCKYCNTLIDLSRGSRTGIIPVKRMLHRFLSLPGKYRTVTISVFLTILSGIFIMLVPFPPEYEQHEKVNLGDKDFISETLLEERASVNEKYYNLIQILKCPEDREKYGDFSDYGYWKGGRWCGKSGKSGYWVWIYPHWYIWKNINSEKAAAADPSINGKYFTLLQVLECPEDRKNYGLFQDYGYWKGGKWCGQQGRAGYWVWIAPKWYVWKGRE